VRGRRCRASDHTGGFCMTPQKGVLSSSLSRNDRAVGSFLTNPAKNDSADGTHVADFSALCRKHSLRMPAQ